MINSGDFLVAEPNLVDGYFEKSVILMGVHNEYNSFGLVLTQKSKLKLHDLADISSDLQVFIGGPVDQNTLHFLHRRPDLIPHSIEISDGVHWSGNFEIMKKYVELGILSNFDIRFFLGYAGWGEGQLDTEISENTWIISKASESLVFDTDPDSLWKEILIPKTVKHFLSDPRLN